jgi:hypothetical protein
LTRERIWRIVGQERVPRGILYKIRADRKEIEILVTNHAGSRIKRWKLDLQWVLETLLYPEEVLKGHGDRFIAHRVIGDHVIRVIYEYAERIPEVVTVYFPYAMRYFEGGGRLEDQILR